MSLTSATSLLVWPSKPKLYHMNLDWTPGAKEKRQELTRPTPLCGVPVLKCAI